MTDKYYGRPVLLVIAKYNEFKSFFINTEVGIRQGAKMFFGRGGRSKIQFNLCPNGNLSSSKLS